MYKDLFSCSDKVAVVTGGCGLIGKEIAAGLCYFGANVYIADTDKEAGIRISKQLKVRYIYLDITSEDSVNKAFNKICKDNSTIDILVNCAYPKTKDWGSKLEQVSLKSWNENINSHLGGYFLSCKAAAQIMKRQKNGSIINLASIYGVTAPDFKIYRGTRMTVPVAYSVIKSGIIAFSKYLATYYAKDSIRVNVVSPGGVFNYQRPAFVKKYSANTPLGIMTKPEDIVGAVIYLASSASKYVTGVNLLVDGGWTIEK